MVDDGWCRKVIFICFFVLDFLDTKAPGLLQAPKGRWCQAGEHARRWPVADRRVAGFGTNSDFLISVWEKRSLSTPRVTARILKCQLSSFDLYQDRPQRDIADGYGRSLRILLTRWSWRARIVPQAL